MSDLAIRVENLGKMYHIGALQQGGNGYAYKSLRETITDVVSAPFRAARALIGGDGTPKAPTDETFWALEDVSFDVKKGEIFGVIGRNGAGKSTLLKLLSRITEPTTGRVEIHGRVGSLLEVGTGFHPELTGRDNVFLNGAILGMKRTEIARNFDAIVAFAGVEKFIDTPVKHYSSGMYLRLAFAVAAHLQTEILIVDEVLAVGDAEFQRKCLGKMQDVSKSGRTVLFVSHNIRAIDALCDKVLYLQSGGIKSQGPVAEQVGAYMQDLSMSEISPDGSPVQIGDLANILFFRLNPNPCTTGSTLHFELGIQSTNRVRLSDLAVLIHSQDDTRVAILDLRKWGLPHDFQPGLYTVSGVISPVQLIAGEYRIGIYAKTNDFDDNLFDLAKLMIHESPTQSTYPPYNPRYRGFVELTYEVDDTLPRHTSAGGE